MSLIRNIKATLALPLCLQLLVLSQPSIASGNLIADAFGAPPSNYVPVHPPAEYVPPQVEHPVSTPPVEHPVSTPPVYEAPVHPPPVYEPPPHVPADSSSILGEGLTIATETITESVHVTATETQLQVHTELSTVVSQHIITEHVTIHQQVTELVPTTIVHVSTVVEKEMVVQHVTQVVTSVREHTVVETLEPVTETIHQLVTEIEEVPVTVVSVHVVHSVVTSIVPTTLLQTHVFTETQVKQSISVDTETATQTHVLTETQVQKSIETETATHVVCCPTLRFIAH